MATLRVVQPELGLLLLILSLSLLCASCRPQPACSDCQHLRGYPGAPAGRGTAYVANASDPAAADIRVPTVTLTKALADTNVTTVVLLTNYSVDEFEHDDAAPPMPVTRNVTITAPPGLMPLFDFKFMRSAVQLCATCLFHMRNISIANERRGNGAAVDFFVGVPGSILKLEDSLRLRLACTTTDSTMELIQRDQPRSPRFPLAGSNIQQQVLAKRNATFHGHAYTDMLWLIDYSYDVPVGFQEGKGIVGGYSMRTINTTRLCLTTVNATCLKIKGPDVCVNEAIDQLLASRSMQAGEQQAQRQQAAAPPGWSSSWLVGVVVPITVVAGLLVAASLALLVVCARHRRQRQEAALYRKSQPPSGTRGAGGSKHLVLPGSTHSSGKEHGSGDGEDTGGGDPFYVDDLGEPQQDQGWEVVAVNTSPSVGFVGNAKIHFGRLIGAGSFGRVYKGRWAGREVAIKCIEHDADTSKAVDNEVQLMLAMDHPNVVKAFHYITYKHSLSVTNSSGDAAAAALPRSQQPSSGSGITPQPSSSEPANPLCGAQQQQQQQQVDQQQQKQQRTLQHLERQLQSELGPRQQFLLDKGLSFGMAPDGSDIDGSCSSTHGDHDCSNSLSGPLPTIVSSSPATTSVMLGSTGDFSRQSTGMGDFSLSPSAAAAPRSSEGGCSSSSTWLAGAAAAGGSADSGSAAFPVAAAGTAGTASPAGGVPIPVGGGVQGGQGVQQGPVHACGTSSGLAAEQQGRSRELQLGACSSICASPAVAVELQGLLQRQLSAETSLLPPEQKQQWQQVLMQLSQQLPTLPDSPQDLQPPPPPPQQQQQQEEGECYLQQQLQQQQQQDDDGGQDQQDGPSHPANGGAVGWYCINNSSNSPAGSSHCLHSSLGVPGGGSMCSYSYPSTGQPLTPNQKLQLQRYLMRQQHLLQTSGMRVRPPPPASLLPNGVQLGSNGRVQQSDNSSDAGGFSSSGNARTVRRTQEQHRSRTYIVQEYCDLGTFTSYASKVLKDPSDNEQMMQLLVLLMDAARGIAALHSKSVVHGDVNARNVLVSSCSSAPYGAEAKLADLGLSRVIRQQATHKTTNTVGTLSHMPPEMLRHGHMSAAVDIYSFAVMMWEVFSGQPAFKHLHYGQFFECIVLQNMRPNIPDDMPRDYSLLMLSCWATNPVDRPSAERLLELLQMMLQERQELQQQLLCGGAGAGGLQQQHGMLAGVGDAGERACAEGVVGATGVEWVDRNSGTASGSGSVSLHLQE